MSRTREKGPLEIRLSLAYKIRVDDAREMLRRGAPKEEVRAKHGLIVLREAQEVIEKGDAT